MSLTAFFRNEAMEETVEAATEDESGEQSDVARTIQSVASEVPRKVLLLGGGMAALAYFGTRRAGSGASVPSTDEVRETVEEAREDPKSVVPTDGSGESDEGEADESEADESEADEGEADEGEADEEEEEEEMEVETEIEIEAGEGVEVEVEAETELEREGENEIEVESEVEVKAERTDDDEDEEEAEEAEEAAEDEEEADESEGVGETDESDEDLPGEERTSEEISERAEGDVDSESPAPGEMNVDDEAVTEIVGEEEDEE